MHKTMHYRPLSRLFCAAALLAGCASPPPAEPPRIERITGAALEAKMPAPVAGISLDDIVAMTKRGESPERIIEEIERSHSIYRLDATQIAGLVRKGVALKVLDHIVETERRRIFDDMAADIAQRERACLDRVEREVRQCRLQSMPIFWPGSPFATCRPPHVGFPYWRCF